ncbi:binding-protein-dependent transport systems inner membrane component [Caldicellulosiruptor hydrothermalis 108]|uniref:Binding-protein-dependent transport systems inner membrane component n=1 Tax=Caldicellulosiruptor hydrothermalis (strain DSM 18901 / VKM B-2411 / 108) TaxID=632292 RepID=E4QCE0_CALH1|nr:sugar ABC transporter permease [Caldicellulosiruptor hydrothermalis]ADQ06236.1 binding-protein-dependent transport systems inner membrane component [Caldicellulosiruptor hydrothermalis 108]
MKSNKELKENLTAYLFLLPWIIGFILFTGGPIIYAFVLGFMKWDLVSKPIFVGIENFKNLLVNNQSFYNSLKVTLIYTLFAVIFTNLWALFLAVLLNQRVRLIGIFQFFYFIPAVLPTVALAFVFQIMLDKEVGVLNYLLSLIGITNGPNWLMDSKWVIPTLIALSIYTYSSGQMMLIYNSALKEVPKELYEAFEIDGGNAFQRFIHVTLPSISPIILFNLVVSTIAILNNSFTFIYPLTGGGPNEVTNVLSLDIYRNAFQLFRMGYAAAEGVILFIIVALLTLAQFVLSKKWVYYESEG